MLSPFYHTDKVNFQHIGQYKAGFVFFPYMKDRMEVFSFQKLKVDNVDADYSWQLKVILPGFYTLGVLPTPVKEATSVKITVITEL